MDVKYLLERLTNTQDTNLEQISPVQNLNIYTENTIIGNDNLTTHFKIYIA